MAKSSDRGNPPQNPEPPGPPATRSDPRGTVAQIDDAPPSGAEDDPALAWERDLQKELPPRGMGSQRNQGEGRHTPTVAEVGPEEADDLTEPTSPVDEGLQTGGSRGESNQAQSGQGTRGGRGGNATIRAR